MCGIMGYIGYGQAVPVIIEGLSRLEYRGYDSAGIAVLNGNGIEITKRKGRLSELQQALHQAPLEADTGIGHTRWATHGVPSDGNAHPHSDCSGRITLVHNGIIENYFPLRKQLMQEGHLFLSETDTEVIAHLVEKYYRGSLEEAVRRALSDLHGSFALAVICQDEPGRIIAAKKDSPLIIGLGENENYLASDIPALLGKTNRVYILEEEEFVIITRDDVMISNFAGETVEKNVFEVDWDPIAAEKGGYDHFMLKEIHEQPAALRQTIRTNMSGAMADLSVLDFDQVFKEIEKIYIVACGTAYHAGLVGKIALEKLARIPVETDIASEFRYRDILWQPNSLMIVVSQSGETADTLAALREARRNGIKVLAVTNVVGSTVAREADRVLYTHAGPEIAVASTKAYSTQLAIMYILALYMARLRDATSGIDLTAISTDLLQLDRQVENVLLQQEKIKQLARDYQDVESTFFLGRGFDYAVAMEGALKLKEISYIHAEAYAAGELKHGPLALIYDGVPVMALITQDHLVDKTMSNIKEVKARGAVVIAICKENLQQACQECDEQILLPEIHPLLAPVLAVIPLQIFSYYMAVFRGCDVDKPRNLAKSVTVE